MSLQGWLARPKALLIWTAALLVAGAWTALRLPLEWSPSVELPSVSVTAAWPGASPRAVERYVAAPLERSLRAIPGTAKIESYSQESQAFLRLEVAPGRDLGLYLAEVSDRVAALRRSLPDRVVPRLAHDVPEALQDEQGFMTLQLVGALDPVALRRLAQERVAPLLRGLPGVAGLTLDGGEERELLLSVDADRLEAHGTSIDAVRNTLSEALASRSYGWLRTPGGHALAWSAGQETISVLSSLAVDRGDGEGGLVRIADLATVSLGRAPLRSLSRVDGKPVVTLRLDRTPGSHLLEASDAVHRAMESLRGDLPAGVDLLVADDRSDDVRRQLRDLAFRGGLSLVAILVVLLAMLGSGRSAALVLGSVAAALALALLLMAPLGLTLNLLTLAGLSLLSGLLVDNAVVVVERLLVERKGGASGTGFAAVRRAIVAVWVPLLGCTLTPAIAFLPMVYLSGEL